MPRRAAGGGPNVSPETREQGEEAMPKYGNVFTLASDGSHTSQPYTSHQKLLFAFTTTMRASFSGLA